jgi:hypothetical protein
MAEYPPNARRWHKPGTTERGLAITVRTQKAVTAGWPLGRVLCDGAETNTARNLSNTRNCRLGVNHAASETFCGAGSDYIILGTLDGLIEPAIAGECVGSTTKNCTTPTLATR